MLETNHQSMFERKHFVFVSSHRKLDIFVGKSKIVFDPHSEHLSSYQSLGSDQKIKPILYISLQIHAEARPVCPPLTQVQSLLSLPPPAVPSAWFNPLTATRWRQHHASTSCSICVCTCPHGTASASSPHCSTGWCPHIHLHGETKTRINQT